MHVTTPQRTQHTDCKQQDVKTAYRAKRARLASLRRLEASSVHSTCLLFEKYQQGIFVMSSPITSVSQAQTPVFGSTSTFDQSSSNSSISLSVRGTHFDLQREDLTTLPESILLCLFPNGLLLDDQEDAKVNVDVRLSIRYDTNVVRPKHTLLRP